MDQPVEQQLAGPVSSRFRVGPPQHVTLVTQFLGSLTARVVIRLSPWVASKIDYVSEASGVWPGLYEDGAGLGPVRRGGLGGRVRGLGGAADRPAASNAFFSIARKPSIMARIIAWLSASRAGNCAADMVSRQPSGTVGSAMRFRVTCR